MKSTEVRKKLLVSLLSIVLTLLILEIMIRGGFDFIYREQSDSSPMQMQLQVGLFKPPKTFLYFPF